MALYGVLARIRDLGLPLLTVERVANIDEQEGNLSVPGGN